MRALGLVLVLVSVALAVVAMLFVRGQKPASGAAVAAGPEIVVAAAPLNFGDHITAGQLRLVRWPQDAVPQGSFSKLDDVVGAGTERVALRAIEAGEPVLASKISGSGGRASLSSIIGSDMRAVTLRVNDATGVAGFILPNDRVDVLITRTPVGETKEQPQTEILLQNVKVLGVDQEVQQKQDQKTAIVAKVVTVEVSPEDTEKLTLGQQIGTLSLALRNFSSRQVVDIGPFSGANLRPSTPPPQVIAVATNPAPLPAPAPAPERAPLQVTIFRGSTPGVAQVNK